ncbi:MAG TPA: protein kinase [Fimbriiglobus sp.]|nr:protein kinase [Fimbriiglobus sp.]
MAGKLRAHDHVTTGEFVQNLTESGLFNAADLLPDAEQLAAAGGAAVAQKLVDAGKLTGYQADALLGHRFGDLLIGNYEILDWLGAGGMGTVFKARHRRMKRVVALKVLSKEVASTERFAQRFQREVETIARLHHPNIVMAYDADEGVDGPFLVMEFVDGRDLESEVEQAGPLPIADAVNCVRQAALGLEYAHARGIVHRDIKPANLLRDTEGVVKVADLGLARLNAADGGSTSLTQAGMVVGTAQYMAPEQAVDSGQVDHRADIYSLGCTLYFLLTGGSPYRAASLMAMLLKHRDDPIPNLCESRPDIPPELHTVFRLMVAKAPEDRYPSMAEVVRDLEQIQSRLSPSRAPTEEWSPQPAAQAARLDQTVELNQTVAVHPVPALEERVAGLTVVLVEPSRTQAGIITRYLSQCGISTVHVTGSGQEGIEVAKRERANVLVCAMHLSDMTGVELARVVATDPACGGLGVVVATSEADAEHAAGLPPGPGVVVLPKPFNAQQLVLSVASVVG